MELTIERKIELEEEIKKFKLNAYDQSYGAFIETIWSREFLESEEVEYTYRAYLMPLNYFNNTFGISDEEFKKVLLEKYKTALFNMDIKDVIEARLEDTREIKEFKKSSEMTLKKGSNKNV